jgi:hypothetical protein
MIDGIIKLLTDDSTIRALVGRNKALTKYKVYPVRCPETEQHPFITIWITSKIPYNCKTGRPTTFEYSFEVHSYAVTYDLVDQIDDAVADALDRQEGTYEGVEFQDIVFKSTKDMFSDYAGGLYVRVSTFDATVDESPVT